MSVITVLLLKLAFTLSHPLYMDYQVQEDYIPILGYHQIDDITTNLIVSRETDYREQIKY